MNQTGKIEIEVITGTICLVTSKDGKELGVFTFNPLQAVGFSIKLLQAAEGIAKRKSMVNESNQVNQTPIRVS